MSLAEKLVIIAIGCVGLLIVLEFSCWWVDRKQRARREERKDREGDDES